MTLNNNKRIWGSLAWLAMGFAQAEEGTGGRAPLTMPVTPFVVPASANTAADGPATAPRWEVKSSDVTLAKTLERWAVTAGHKLKWDASRDFLIGAPDVYVGTFEGALQHVLRSPGIQLSDYPLEACVYANTPPLVRITRQGEQSRECAAEPTP